MNKTEAGHGIPAFLLLVLLAPQLGNREGKKCLSQCLRPFQHQTLVGAGRKRKHQERISMESLGGNTKGREMKKFELSLPKTNASALLFRGISYALVCKNGRYR